ncbi:MAG: response regulator, partial [Bacteroides sp.]|nr:response regulator [Bacteroides sp.]
RALSGIPGKGSTFTLLLPEGNAHFSGDSFEIISVPRGGEVSVPNSIAEEEKQETGVPGKKRTLLIIEDNEEIRRYINSLFCKEYVVYEAVDGEEGVRIATDKVPNLIISDIMMPMKDGFTCCRELRGQPQTAHIPILMLTAKAEDADVLQAFRIGVDDYMMKPFNPEILKSKAKNLILQRERLKRIYTKTLMLKQQAENSLETCKDPSKDDFVKQVIQIIEAHISDENFSVRMLADQLNMSQPTLYRKIKQCSELAAIDMIRSVRMSKAASLIMENKYSIQEIAEMVGYSDTRTLRKHFIEQFGVAPSKYMYKE